MTSNPYGHIPFRSGLINQAGKKRRTSDELPTDIDNYVPFAQPRSEQNQNLDLGSPPYWQELGTQVGRQLLQLGILLFKRLMSWRPRELLGLPLVLILLWGLVLWWGEEAVFRRKVESCRWDHWETWVSSSNATFSSTLTTPVC